MAVLEAHHRGDGESAADIGDVKALDARGRLWQPQRLSQRHKVLVRLDRDGKLLGQTLVAAALFCAVAKIIEHVAKFGGFFEVQFRRGLLHLLFDFCFHFFGLTVKECASGFNLPQVVLP